MTGFTDVLPVREPKVLALAARLYQLAGPPSEAEFRELAEVWRPFRTWAVVLIRAAARRILDDERLSRGGEELVDEVVAEFEQDGKESIRFPGVDG